jgi:hypothetical protein
LDYLNLEKYFSPHRLNRYLIACGNSKIKAQNLYRANLRIAQSFYPVLNLFEVVLRNILYDKLSLHFNNTNWIINEINGFMNDNSLQPQFYLKNEVLKAQRKLQRNHQMVTSGRIISEQTFGFWTSLFERYHYKLINGVIIQCFVNKPNIENRVSILSKLQNIRDFRNRVYHNEPICFSGNSIDLNISIEVKKNIFDLLNWINSDIAQYVDYFDNIDSKITIAQNI